MPFNGDSQSAGGVFESADVPGPVFERGLEYQEVRDIRNTDAFKTLRAAVERRKQVGSAAPAARARAAAGS